MKEEVQKKYMELQLIQRQLQAIQQQVQALESQAGEMDLVQQVLEEFSMSAPGSDSFVTLTPGVFVKAKVLETDKVVLNIGAGAAVEKSIPDAKKIMADQGVELRKLQEELIGQLQKFAQRAEQLQDELRSLVKE